ncbi:Nucleoside triphosphate hydrolase protein [Mycena kentingensis (nom. inval.)]|nr:Nucleoside triphosphate hydrolase protein [Mycena kentingensis (nom. inval.)]
MVHSPLPFDCPHPVNSAEWLDQLLRERCKVSKLWPHQLELSMHLIEGKDVFSVSATGTGKTVVLQAPAIAAQARGESGIALMIVPTKVLVEQQADAASKRGLNAFAINQDTVREAQMLKRDLFDELLRSAGVRVAVMTPSMLRSTEMQELLRKPAFKDAVRWLPIDEAHLVAQEDSVFYSGYLSLAHLRVRLHTTVVWSAATATAPPVDALRQAAALGFKPGSYINARYSVDRPNLRYIPRIFQHASTGNEFLDISFVVPLDLKQPDDIQRTIIFADYIKRGNAIMKFVASDWSAPSNCAFSKIICGRCTFFPACFCAWKNSKEICTYLPGIAPSDGCLACLWIAGAGFVAVVVIMSFVWRLLRRRSMRICLQTGAHVFAYRYPRHNCEDHGTALRDYFLALRHGPRKYHVPAPRFPSPPEQAAVAAPNL